MKPPYSNSEVGKIRYAFEHQILRDQFFSNPSQLIRVLMVKDGLYELSETVTPSGYIPSAPMYFYIADDGTVSSVTISDDCSYKIGDKIGDGTNYSEDKVDAIVLMVNRKKVNSAVEDNIKESPNTGGIHVVVALVLLGISLATIFVTMSFGRKIEKI